MKRTDESALPINVKRHQLSEEVTKREESSFAKAMVDHSSRLYRELDIDNFEAHQGEVNFSTVREQASKLSSLLQIRPQTTFDLELFSGVQLISPPYDTDWNLGTGTPFTSWDGTSIIFGSDGFSASGFGVNLSSQRQASVSVMPQGSFTAGWANFDPPTRLRSIGGTGAVVYGDGDLLVSRQPRVWDVTSPDQFASANFQSPFASTATPAFPGSFGPVPLAPVIFDMLPDKRYLVWFYIWQINVSISGRGFLVFSEAKVPLLTISTGDPLFIH